MKEGTLVTHILSDITGTATATPMEMKLEDNSLIKYNSITSTSNLAT